MRVTFLNREFLLSSVYRPNPSKSNENGSLQSSMKNRERMEWYWDFVSFIDELCKSHLSIESTSLTFFFFHSSCHWSSPNHFELVIKRMAFSLPWDNASLSLWRTTYQRTKKTGWTRDKTWTFSVSATHDDGDPKKFTFLVSCYSVSSHRIISYFNSEWSMFPSVSVVQKNVQEY